MYISHTHTQAYAECEDRRYRREGETALMRDTNRDGGAEGTGLLLLIKTHAKGLYKDIVLFIWEGGVRGDRKRTIQGSEAGSWRKQCENNNGKHCLDI